MVLLLKWNNFLLHYHRTNIEVSKFFWSTIQNIRSVFTPCMEKWIYFWDFDVDAIVKVASFDQQNHPFIFWTVITFFSSVLVDLEYKISQQTISIDLKILLLPQSLLCVSKRSTEVSRSQHIVIMHSYYIVIWLTVFCFRSSRINFTYLNCVFNLWCNIVLS